jgi:inosine-uridine nucleoside N-ribohydrolase
MISKQVEIVALTCVHGNTTVRQATLNAARLCDIIGRDIPIYEVLRSLSLSL